MGNLWWHFTSPLWWNLCWFVANAVLVGRRGYIFYMEAKGLSASKQFTLRSDSLPYVSVWAVFAIATFAFGVLAGDVADLVNAVGVLVAEFVAVCLWVHYYGNGDLVCQVVNEIHDRTSYLLIHGLGMSMTERERFWKEVETAIVEFWTTRLAEKNWIDLTIEERDALLFDTGLECAKVVENQWEGILYDVAAFFHEWLVEVKRQRALRVPAKVAESIQSGNDAGRQSLLSVAVLIANEDESLRKKRADEGQIIAERQFCGARIARRKAAAEGILRWPDVLRGASHVDLTAVELNTDELFIVHGQNEYQCEQTQLPYSVLYTLSEIVRAGYVKSQLNGEIQATVIFKYGNMVFDKEDWNPLSSIRRKPFRYISSVTRMVEDIAFVVEQREFNGSDACFDGSGYLKGTLKISANGETVCNHNPWIARSDPPAPGKVWGPIDGIEQAKSLPFIHKPTLWTTRSTLWLLDRLTRLYSFFRSPKKEQSSFSATAEARSKTEEPPTQVVSKLVLENSLEYDALDMRSSWDLISQCTSIQSSGQASRSTSS